LTGLSAQACRPLIKRQAWAVVLASGVNASELSALLAGSAEFISAHGGLDATYALDQEATTPTPIRGTADPDWLERERQNEARAALGHAPILFRGDSITEWLALGAGQPLWDSYLDILGTADFAIGGLGTGNQPMAGEGSA
jgi:hypothetical protein